MSPEAPPTDDLARRAREVLAGGSTHVARSYQPPLFVTRAHGARKWLADGRELVDYTMGHGALILGHSPAVVVEAARRQVERGTHFGAGSVLEIEWAELIRSLVPSAERIRFTASGTEAVMLALRLARAATGRDPIVKFDDHFHGWYDAVSVNLGPDGSPMALPGVPALTVAGTRVIPPGDLSRLEPALEGAAAVIIEASGAHYGTISLDPTFIAAVREACDATGALLIIDEVVTGFRVAPGGLQSCLGVVPDLTAFGKIMAGGLPGGAVGGLGSVLDAAIARVAHPGTFNANPLTAAAGIATLDAIADGTALRQAEAYAAELESAWRCSVDRSGIPGRVWRFSSIVHSRLDDPEAQSQLGNLMRAEGVDLFHTSAFCSTAHGAPDLELTVAALERALGELARGSPPPQARALDRLAR